MHEFFLDLWRLGKELRGEYGGLLTLLASLWIVGTAVCSIAARAGKAAQAVCRWLVRTPAPATEDETCEGA